MFLNLKHCPKIVLSMVSLNLKVEEWGAPRGITHNSVHKTLPVQPAPNKSTNMDLQSPPYSFD